MLGEGGEILVTGPNGEEAAKINSTVESNEEGNIEVYVNGRFSKLNYEITKNVFQVRIINLEELSIKIVKEIDGYYIQFFDDKAFDKKCKLNIENLDKKLLKIRINKKIKMFE